MEGCTFIYIYMCGKGLEAEAKTMMDDISFPRLSFIYTMAVAHILRYRHPGKPYVCEYLLNILPCPEGKNKPGRGALPT